jgi:hypothetical protein
VLDGACTRQRRATYRRSTGIRLDVKGRAGMQPTRVGEAVRPQERTVQTLAASFRNMLVEKVSSDAADYKGLWWRFLSSW